MRKILFILPVLLFSLFSAAQTLSPTNTPGTVGRSNSSVNVEDNKLWARQVLGAPRYNDTTQANSYSGALDSCGRLIYTYNVRGFWWRACLPTGKKWVRFGDISTFNFFTDSSIIICNGANVCDTIPMSNFTTIVTNIVQNFNDSSVYFFNDSTLIICTGEGEARVCDTIDLGTTNTYYFTPSGDTLITCDTIQIICDVPDSCYQQQVCDTILLGQPIVSPVYQNLLRQIPGTPIREGGNATETGGMANLLHDTWLYTNPFQLTIHGIPNGRPPLAILQSQWSQLSSSITSFSHYGAYRPDLGLLDENNTVKLRFNYTDPFVIPAAGTLSGDTVGFMGNRYGYLLMTNSEGNNQQYFLDDIDAKQVGVFFDTYSPNTEAVTIFGNQVPARLAFITNPPTDSTLLEARIAVFHTTGLTQLNKYGDGDFTAGTPTYLVATDADGNLMEYPPGGVGAVGTVTTFSAGNLSPLFTTSVANPTTTPALTFSLSNAAGGTVFGRSAGTTGAPAYTSTPVLGIAGTTLGTLGFAGNTSGTITIQPQAAAGTFNFNLPTTAGTSGYFLTSGGGGSTAMTWTQNNFITGITADNGLTENVANNVQLFGTVGTPATLLSDRHLNAGIYKLDIVSAFIGGGSGALTISASAGDAIYSISNNGSALVGQSTNTYAFYGVGVGGIYAFGDGLPPAKFETTGSTSAVDNILQLHKAPNSSVSAGVGGAIDFYIKTTTGLELVHFSNRIQSIWTDPAAATRNSEMKFLGVNAGTPDVLLMNLASNGSVQIRPISAAAASAITPAEGMFLIVNTTDATFTSTGFWGYSGGAWGKLTN